MKQSKHQVNIEYAKWIMSERDKINRIPFDKLELVYLGVPVEVSEDVKNHFELTGLTNMDFITSNYYKCKRL